MSHSAFLTLQPLYKLWNTRTLTGTMTSLSDVTLIDHHDPKTHVLSRKLKFSKIFVIRRSCPGKVYALHWKTYMVLHEQGLANQWFIYPLLSLWGLGGP